MKTRTIAIVFWGLGGVAHTMKVLIPAIQGEPIKRGAVIAAGLAAVGLSGQMIARAVDE